MMNIIRVLFVCFILVGCSNAKNSEFEIRETLKYDGSIRELCNSELFEGITIITLDSKEIVSSDSEILMGDNDYYYIVNKFAGKISIFNSIGEFVGSIDNKGRGANEYLGITNVWYDNKSSVISIYSYHNNKIFNYSKDGYFLSTTDISQPVIELQLDNDHYWGYLGYANTVMSERLIKTSLEENKIIDSYLYSESKIIPVTEPNNVIIPYDGKIYIRESLNRDIYCIDASGEHIALRVDYGKYNIPDKYYEASDPFKAAELLLSSTFASNYAFFVNDDIIVLQTIIQEVDLEAPPIYALAIKHKNTGVWQWFNNDKRKQTENIFDTPVKFLTNNSEILFLVDPYKFNTDTMFFRDKDILYRVNENDNAVIVKCKLKV